MNTLTINRLVIFTGVLLLLMLAAACDRYIDSREPTRSLPEMPPTPTNLTAVVNDQSIDLSWQISNPQGIARYRIYRTEDSSGTFTLSDSTTSTSISLTGLPVNRLFFFRVAAVSGAGIEGERSDAVSARSGILGMSIEDNDRFTNSRDVRIQLLTTGATTHVILSEDQNFTDSLLLPFGATVNYELSDGDGVKTVYARFVFSDGSRSGQPVSDDIILDTRARIESVTFDSPDSLFSTGDTITFFLDAGEEEGFAEVTFEGANPVRLFNDGTNGDVSAGDNIFTGQFIVPQDFAVTDGVVTGEFTDRAGNQAPDLVSTDRLDIVSAPIPVQLTLVEALSSFEINLVWTRATGSNFASYRIFRSTTPTVDQNSTLVKIFSNVNTTSLIDTTLDASTTYYYAVFLRDNIGRDTISNVLSATTLTNDPPTAVTLAGSLESSGTTARLSWSTNSDDDFESYRIYKNKTNLNVTTTDQLVGYISGRNTTTFSDFISNSVDSAFYRVFVFDRHGAQTGSNAVRVDANPGGTP